MSSRLAVALLLAATLPAAAAPPVVPFKEVELATHRAVYEFRLASAKTGGAVTDMTGRMVYEITGSPCDGYTQTMRFVTRMIGQDGAATLGDMRSTSFEDPTGRRFTFASTQRRDEKVSETVRGSAERDEKSGDIAITLVEPARAKASLPAEVLFPNQHIIMLITAGRAGQVFYEAPVYDGSDKGDKAYNSTTVIGRRQAPGADRDIVPKVAGTDRLEQLASWPVSISYFEQGKGQQDGVPQYEFAFRLYENGVSRRLYIDYGDYAIRGVLKEIEWLEPGVCRK